MENNLPQPSSIKRVVTLLLDSFPWFGRICTHKFTTTRGAGAVFRWSSLSYDGERTGSFYIEINKESAYWTAPELREFAAECNYLADYLEGKKKWTIIQPTSE